METIDIQDVIGAAAEMTSVNTILTSIIGTLVLMASKTPEDAAQLLGMIRARTLEDLQDMKFSMDREVSDEFRRLALAHASSVFDRVPIPIQQG
jgi:hypothetical protein